MDESKELSYLFYLPRCPDSFTRLGEEVKLPAKYELCKQDEVPACCYVIKEGRAICYDYTERGQQRIYTVFEPNSMLLEECVLHDKPCHVRFRTITPSTMQRITKCDLKKALKHDIDFVLDFTDYLSGKFLSYMEFNRLSLYRNAEWRVCKHLQILMERYGRPYDDKILIDEKVTQQMIADTLGINRVTISRIFQNLKGVFLMQINGYYCIRSAELLQKHMDSLCK